MWRVLMPVGKRVGKLRLRKAASPSSELHVDQSHSFYRLVPMSLVLCPKSVDVKSWNSVVTLSLEWQVCHEGPNLPSGAINVGYDECDQVLTACDMAVEQCDVAVVPEKDVSLGDILNRFRRH